MTVKMKKGGEARLIAYRVATGDVVTIPAGFRISAITAKKIGTTAGTITIETPANDVVVNAHALGTVDGAFVALTLAGFTHYTTATRLDVTLSNAAATADISFQIQKVL